MLHDDDDNGTLTADPGALRARWLNSCERAGLALSEDGFWRHTPLEPRFSEGWKIHVSANLLDACDVLDSVLEVLRARDAHFKVAANLGVVMTINAGLRSPYSQIGKLITIYPGGSRRKAIDLGKALVRALPNSPHPAVPSDVDFEPGYPVYYRWGAYKGTEVSGPDGPVEDVRQRDSAVRAWMIPLSPREREPDGELKDTSYRIIAPRIQRGKGGVFDVFDLDSNTEVVLKQGRRNGEQDFLGFDGWSRLKREEAVLNNLAEAGIRVPGVIDAFDRQSSSYLVLERINGESLDSLLRDDGYAEVPWGQRVELALSVMELVRAIDAAGWVWGDVKASNIIASIGGRFEVRPIDFEGAVRDGELCVPWISPGYRAPELETAEVLNASFGWDAYALGITCKQLLLGISDPTQVAEAEWGETLDDDHSRAWIIGVVEGLLDADVHTRIAALHTASESSTSKPR